MHSEHKTMSNGRELINFNISERKTYNGFKDNVIEVLCHVFVNGDQIQNRSS